jgi:Fur family ferric uptake transcriptional regulator
MPNRLEQLCVERGLRLNGKRRAILTVLDRANDHPTVEDVYRRTLRLEPDVSLATVYRTIKQLSEWGLLTCHNFGNGRARYEEARGGRHEHLIDVRSGKVVEFEAPELADLIREIAAGLGYGLVEYRLEVFAQRQGAVPARAE